MSRKMTVWSLLLTVILFAGWASATAIIDFGMIAPTSGQILYGGGGGPLVGTNIQVDQVTGEDTPVNNLATLPISGGLLNFTTGPQSVPGLWAWGGGGAIVLTGGIAALGIPDGSVLMSGQFGTAYVTPSSGTFKIAGGGFYDLKHPVLAEYFGLGNYAQRFWVGNMNISFMAAGTEPDAFTSTKVLSGDVVNAIPEPASLLLMGSGLVGVATFLRRKISA